MLRAILERSDPNDPKCHDSETLAAWHFHPRARWAMPLPDDYRFPLALLEWIAAPTGDYGMMHACGRCGLIVPTVFNPMVPIAFDRPHPEPYPFATCPACGGTTSSAACQQAGEKPA